MSNRPKASCDVNGRETLPAPDNATALTGLGAKGTMWAVGWAIHRQGGAGIQVSKATHKAKKLPHIRPQDAHDFMAKEFGDACPLEGCPTRRSKAPGMLD